MPQRAIQVYGYDCCIKLILLVYALACGFHLFLVAAFLSNKTLNFLVQFEIIERNVSAFDGWALDAVWWIYRYVFLVVETFCLGIVIFIWTKKLKLKSTFA